MHSAIFWRLELSVLVPRFWAQKRLWRAHMGASAVKIDAGQEDGIDLGPPEALPEALPGSLHGCVCSLKTLAAQAFLVAQGSLLVESKASSGEPFVLEQGLWVRGRQWGQRKGSLPGTLMRSRARRCSLRSLRRPLDYLVALESEHVSRVSLSRYDGSEPFRAGATFELRVPERDGLLQGSDSARFVCFMLAERPGLYLWIDKDGRLAVQKYSFRGREAFYFQLVDEEGTAPSLVVDVESPVLGSEPAQQDGPLGFLASLDFTPSFSLPVPGDPDLEKAVMASLALEDVKDVKDFDPVD